MLPLLQAVCIVLRDRKGIERFRRVQPSLGDDLTIEIVELEIIEGRD